MQSKRKYIVRCARAGLYYGEIAESVDNWVEMRNVRKIFKWRGGAYSPEDIATIGTTNPAGMDLTVCVPKMTVLEPIQIIPCSKQATEVLDAIPEWRYDKR